MQNDFVISSAFVRILGAHEQFERDCLKSLFYYRPAGRSVAAAEYTEQSVEEDVVLEEGRKDGDKLVFEKPPIWTWLSKQAENNIERQKIFSNVFGLSSLPDKSAKKLHTDLYERRNAIVHGRQGVKMTLREYCDAEEHVVACIFYLVDGIREQFKLIL